MAVINFENNIQVVARTDYTWSYDKMLLVYLPDNNKFVSMCPEGNRLVQKNVRLRVDEPSSRQTGDNGIGETNVCPSIKHS